MSAPMTLETLSARIEEIAVMVRQINITLAGNPDHPKKTSNEKEKKDKKEKKADSDTDKPKTKRVSGYILFSKAMRDEATDKIRSEMEDEEAKIKSTEIMKELGRMWKELSEEDKEPWNTQAMAMKEASE